MAEAIFNALAEDAGLCCRARSAGLAAPIGASTAPRSIQALTEIGVFADPGHAARQVDEVMVTGAGVVLAMTPRQATELRRLFGDHAGKIYSLAEYVGEGPDAGVSDPYGHTRAAFRASARQLLGYLETLVFIFRQEESRYSERLSVNDEASRTWRSAPFYNISSEA